MKPFIDPAFWSDPNVEKQPAGIKLCFLWLVTNSQTSLLGICSASKSRFTFETGLKSEALQRACEALPTAFKKVGDAIFVRNYIRHQFGTGDKLKKNNFFVALKSLFISVKDESLRDEILKEYPEFLEALTKGFVRACQAQGKERIGKKEESAERKHIPTLPEVREYAKEIGMPPEEAEGWFDHFESNGWKVSGKAPMKDWRAGLRNGLRRTGKQPVNGHVKSQEIPPDFKTWFDATHPGKTIPGGTWPDVPEYLKSDWRKARKT